MQRSTIVLLSSIILSLSQFSLAADPNVTLQWQGGQSQGSWQMLPANPNTTNRITFAGPTTTFSNMCYAKIQIQDGLPWGLEPPYRVQIDNTNKIITLSFGPPEFGVSCTAEYDPVYAFITVNVGPLAKGQWTFRSNRDFCLFNQTFTVTDPPKYSGGDGTAENPWKISTKADLLALGANTADYNDCFVMTNDINLAGDIYSRALIAPRNWYSAPIPAYFTGVFDGNNFDIIKLTINSTNIYECLGLFGHINGARISNLGIEQCNISGKDHVAGLVGYNLNSTILNCHVIGQINDQQFGGLLVGESRGLQNKILDCHTSGTVNGTSDWLGGLVGLLVGGSISDCNSSADVFGNNNVGGLVGGQDGGNLINCSATGNIHGITDRIGGLVGQNGGSVSQCFAACNVTGHNYVGGLLGANYLTISNCYSIGFVNGNNYVGGFIGYTAENISDCYCISDVNSPGTKVGGLIGSLSNTTNRTVSNCFWNTDIQTHGITQSLGFIQNGIVSNVTPLTTAKLQQKAIYTTAPANWDFINIWAIGDNQTYPYLRQHPASDIDQDSKVDYKDLALLAENWLSGI